MQPIKLTRFFFVDGALCLRLRVSQLIHDSRTVERGRRRPGPKASAVLSTDPSCPSRDQQTALSPFLYVIIMRFTCIFLSNSITLHCYNAIRTLFIIPPQLISKQGILVLKDPIYGSEVSALWRSP